MVEPDSFRRLLEARAPVVGRVVRPPAGGAEYVFPIRVPVLRDGELKYTLSAIVNVDSLARVIPRQLPEEWTRSILDSEGTIARAHAGRRELRRRTRERRRSSNVSTGRPKQSRGR